MITYPHVFGAPIQFDLSTDGHGSITLWAGSSLHPIPGNRYRRNYPPTINVVHLRGFSQLSEHHRGVIA